MPEKHGPTGAASPSTLRISGRTRRTQSARPHQQFFGSLVLSTHFEAQQATITAMPEHALAQEPQLVGLLVKSTQAIPRQREASAALHGGA